MPTIGKDGSFGTGEMVRAVDFMATVDTCYVWELNIWYIANLAAAPGNVDLHATRIL